MRTMSNLFIFLFVCLLTACASTEAPVSKTRMWLGTNKQNLLNEWGKPSNITTLPNGNALYQYTRTRTRTTPYPTAQRGVMIVGGNQVIGYNLPGNIAQQAVYRCYTDFEITPDDKIKSVQQRGGGC